MLIGLDSRLTPELLFALAAMGHGDQPSIVDASFPAHAAGLDTLWRSCVDFGGTAPEALDAILSLLPIDTFDPERPPVRAMRQVDAPDILAPPVSEARTMIRAMGHDIAMNKRFAFYAEAKNSFVIVRTRERRFYGNFILRKGVVRS